MANEIRLRTNNLSGAISDNPLPQVSTTINSPGFANLPVVNGTNHLILILDPLQVSGAAEIVQVTAHTAAATSVTVVRGFDGSTPRAHILNETWFHGPVVSDWNYTDKAALSTNRPATPVQGQMIYETDTKKLMVYNGTDWNPNQAGGQLGYVETTTTATTSAGTELTVLTTPAITVGTNRRVKVSFKWWDTLFTVSGDQFFLRMKEDGGQFDAFMYNTLTGLRLGHNFWSVRTPSAGSHVYTVTAQRNSGTGTLSLNAGAGLVIGLLVEDIGAA